MRTSRWLARWHSVPYGRSAVFVLVALGAIGFLPLFDGPGYEQALATGLLVPSATAVAIALDAARRAGAGAPGAGAAGAGAEAGEVPRTPLATLGRGVVLGLALAGIALLTALLHAVRVGICELWGALLYFVLTAGIGCVMGGTWVAALVRRVRIEWPRRRAALAVVLSLLGPIGCAAISVGRFVTSPMIFAYDPFVGYFSGTLYDTVIDAGSAMLTYRVGSFATVSAVALFASLLERREDRPFGLVLDLRTTATRGRALVALAATVASVGIIAFGSRLGHFSTGSSIAKDLGAEKRGIRCDVVYPSTTREQEANLLVKDCDEEVAAVEKRLGAKGPARIRAFFFRDADDKKRLMGAAHTYLAKPWREEVYLQLSGYPHPVLGHELAHVIAGSFGRGPFKIAGDVGGLLPNPGLIEGMAVAASPDDEDLTDAQWARAMMQIGILPDMRSIFSLEFLGGSSFKSYTLAGAFITWLGERFGFDVARAWYAGGDVTALTKLDWPALDKAFRDDLRKTPLPKEAESFARAKFAGPGIFGRKCPHVVDALRHEADVCRDTQRYDEAIRLYNEAIAKDAHDFASQKELATVERRHGDREKGRLALLALATADEKSVPRTTKDRAEESLADAQFVDGDFEGAASRWDALAARTIDEDVARTLEIKSLGARDGAAREAIRGLLLGDVKHGPDIFWGGIELGAWGASNPSGLAAYLAGRNFVGRGFYEVGASTLDVALTRGTPTARVTRETLRQRAIAACALDDRAALDRVRARIEAPDDPFHGASGGRRESTLRMIARCAK
jgi:tetratricopeptide (TPR) repeat protein